MPQSPPKEVPPQHQDRRPGLETEMHPKPQLQMPGYKGSGKLKGKVALITGGDSGIGAAAAIMFAQEGADVAIVYLNEHEDAKNVERLVKEQGRRCELIAGDVGDKEFCKRAVDETVNRLGGLNILVNNAAEQHPKEDIREISEEQLVRTFRTNIFAMFFLAQAALPHLKEGDRIINVSSVTSYRGSEHLLDYASTKGAIVAFTRSLSTNLAEQKINVNAVAPGPVWTPLIPSTFDEEKVETFGQDVPLGRPAQPYEIAPCFVFLASADAVYMTGQVLHPNGGSVVNT